MKWALRFIGFATLLAIPCFFLTGPWQRALGAVAAGVVGVLGHPIDVSEVQIMAPFDIGVFVAMCLASRRAPALARRRALEWGIPIMIVLEVLTIVVAVLGYFAFHREGAANDAGGRLVSSLIEFVPWASATTVWLLLLGAWELPLAATSPPVDVAPPGRPGPRPR